jgi:hypothetical protein
VPIEGAQVDGANLAARRARKREPREPGPDRGTNSRVESKLTPASLPRIPNRDDFLGFGDGLPFGFGALRSFRGKGSGALPFLCATVRTHDRNIG